MYLPEKPDAQLRSFRSCIFVQRSSSLSLEVLEWCFLLQVLCWGVRNMKRYQLASVASPSIEFECGGHVVHSTVIKNTQKHPNFDQPLFFFDVVSV